MHCIKLCTYVCVYIYVHVYVFTCLCCVYSHIDSVWFEGSVTECVTVLFSQTVVLLSDDIVITLVVYALPP